MVVSFGTCCPSHRACQKICSIVIFCLCR
jgi:hypothetical protein